MRGVTCRTEVGRLRDATDGTGGGGMRIEEGLGLILGEESPELLRVGRWKPITAEAGRWYGLPPEGDPLRGGVAFDVEGEASDWLLVGV